MISAMTQRLFLAAASALALAACAQPVPRAAPAPDVDWAHYGGDAGGQRFSPAAQITPANVRGLKVAWTYSTGSPGILTPATAPRSRSRRFWPAAG